MTGGADRSILPRTTVSDALRAGAAGLQGVADNPRLEARLLLAHALAVTQNDLIREPGRMIDTAAYGTLLRRRRAQEPLAHLVGRREFWSLDFRVTPATLIPRPDTETLVEAALAAFGDRSPPARILDLGTGTGCLLLALLHEYRTAFGIGVDIEPAAAALARDNASSLGLTRRAAFAVSDWTNAVGGRFDLVVSNPPYIAAGEIPSLMPEVARYEPARALDGGADGYDAYRTILARLPEIMTAQGVAVLELGRGQANVVAGLARDLGFAVSLRLDLAGIPRAMILNGPGR